MSLLQYIYDSNLLQTMKNFEEVEGDLRYKPTVSEPLAKDRGKVNKEFGNLCVNFGDCMANSAVISYARIMYKNNHMEELELVDFYFSDQSDQHFYNWRFCS